MGKTLTEMRADIRLDLKDTSVLLLWSEDELQRCIDRAVADLSRFLPRQKTYDVTVDYDVDDEAFTTPADADPDYFVDNVTLNGETAGATLSIAHISITNPSLLTFLLTDANNSISSLTIVVKGTDRDGNYIEESFHLSGSKSQTGKKEFRTVQQVILDYIGGSASAADVVDIGTTNPYDVWVQLANKPIKPGTEAIDGSHSRDTDYIMDYANGRIKYTDAGNMAAATAYVIDYEKSQIDIDLAPIKHELIRVDRLIYPASDIPQTFVTPDIWGDVLTIMGGVSESQTEMSDKYHAVVRYLASHTPPSVDAPGSYPDFLDNTVMLAATAYALFMMALKYEHQAATDMAAVRTILTTTIVHTSLGTALGNAGAKAALAGTALGKVSGLLTAIGTQDNASDVLSEIHDMETYLRDTIIKLNDGTGMLKSANDQLNAVATEDFNLPTYGAVVLVKTVIDADYINKVNIGDRVPENYREYAQTIIARANARVNTALGLIREAEARMAFLRTYIEESTGWVRIAETFIAEASQRAAEAGVYIAEAQVRLAELNEYLAEAAQYQATADANMLLADKWRTEAIERRNEAWSVWKDPKQYIGDFSLSLPLQPGTYK